MFFRILKQDLKKKKAVNVIILLFIIMATMLIAASVNTLLSSTNAVDDYLERAKVPDYMCAIYDIPGEKDRLEDFFDDENVEYDREKYIVIEEIRGIDGKEKESDGLISKMPKNYGKVFDRNGKEIILENDQMALTELAMKDIGVEEGARIKVTVNELTKEFEVIQMYDAMYGTAFVSLNRMIVTDSVYEEYEDGSTRIAYFYNIDIDGNVQVFNQKLIKGGFNFIGMLAGENFGSCYFFEKLSAVLMCVVSVILVLISFLILRFTIVFTIQEEYREIGIMKAMGMKKGKIKSIYLTKYLFLDIVGAIIGFVLSFPVYFVMTKETTASIFVGLKFSYVMTSLIFVIIVVLVIEGFCYLCTRKIDKLSPITSIRNGKETESYKKKRKIKMHKHSFAVSTQMALGDIISGFKRFFLLFLTFFLCTMILILSFATTGTLKSDKLIDYFGVPEFDVHFYGYEEQGRWYEKTSNEIVEGINDFEKEFESKGIVMDVYGEAMCISTMQNANDENKFTSIVIRKTYNRSIADYPYTSGKAPILANEVAITNNMSYILGVKIGDKVEITIMDNSYELIVTGFYDSMYNIGGLEARASDEFELSTSAISSLSYYGYNCETDNVTAKLSAEYKDYSFSSMNEYLNNMIGSIRDSLDYMMFIIMLAISLILVLMVFLINKLLISRETPEIAMLKSLGLSNRNIYAWQVKRMAFVVGLSSIILISSYSIPNNGSHLCYSCN